MILGITGGSGSGKTTLLQQIEAAGGEILDCDAIYHRLLQTDTGLLCAIESRFPGVVEQGVLNRKKLGNIVFSDEDALLDLNRITHTAVKAEVIRLLAHAPKLAAIDAIGLFESGLDKLCDVTVAVTAPIEIRIQRLTERDGISQEYAKNRILAQHTDDWFCRRCDYVLENNCEKSEFQAKCVAFLRELGIMNL